MGQRRQWLGEQAAFLLVVLALTAAFVFLAIEPHHWREGAGALSAAVLLAGLLRAVVPSARVGMLAVRARWTDSVFYLVLGGLILALAIRLHA